MQILNATTSVKNLFADNGDMITIKPGETSRLIIASKNIITAAMSLGTPKEIAIILGGSYDRDIAKEISGAIPYLYSDLDEAKSKLIDPSIDYKGNANADMINIRNEQEVIDLKKELAVANDKITDLNKTVLDLTTKLENANHDSIAKYNELDANFMKVQKERDNYKNQLQESQDQVSNLTKDKNTLNKQLGSMQVELTAATNSNNDLNKQLTELKANSDSENSELSKNVEDLLKENKQVKESNDKLTAEIKDLQAKLEEAQNSTSGSSDELKAKDEEIETLKKSLEETTNKIKTMANEFNAACEKFNIGKDENGEWVQGE